MLNTLFLLMIAFSVKHFICDFPLQATPYIYENKGTLLHWGGWIHAAWHATFTMLVITTFVPSLPHHLVPLLGLGEGLIHYVIDYAKVNINKHFNLKPNNSEAFWILLGFDQLLHGLTYIGILWVVMINA